MKIALSCGDCNGIGIEVMLKSIARINNDARFNEVQFHIATHPQTLLSYTHALGFDVTLNGETVSFDDREYPLINCVTQAQVRFGEEQRDAGALAKEALERAVDSCLQHQVDAMVTMPVSKTTLHSAGFHFPGQTEFLASRCAMTQDPLMMLCHETLRVALLTIHMPLHSVPQYVRRHRIVDHLQALHTSLQRDFGIDHPRIAVLGLNPHAGESGHIGDEEIEQIIPALRSTQSSGIHAEGPFPADGFFAHGAYKHYDGILAMYHDQGLIPLKLIAEGAGINYTAGLPIVRTSPDHGTAFALAGRNVADERSTVEAIHMAVDIARRRAATPKLGSSSR